MKEFADDQVSFKSDNRYLLLVRKNINAYLVWYASFICTTNEVRKLHRHFYHPHPDRIYAVMKQKNPIEFWGEFLADFKRISSMCDAFKSEEDGPHRFRASVPDSNWLLYLKLRMDLILLDVNSVSHVVYKDTYLNEACFMEGQSTADLWNAFMRIWLSPYVGYPAVSSDDPGPQLRC